MENPFSEIKEAKKVIIKRLKRDDSSGYSLVPDYVKILRKDGTKKVLRFRH